VLNDPTVEAAVLETARGGILREGLAWKRCDVGAVLNVTEDHLGVKGIDTLQDLAKIKRIVVEAVERRGVSVLNADDPITARMVRDAGGRISFFSLNGGERMSRQLRRHIEDGGTAVVSEGAGNSLVIYHGGDLAPEPLMDARDIPATLGGAARFNIANALAAAAIALGAGIPVDTIRRGLATFESNYENNPGRLNVYDGHPFRVILDYAHNPEGMRQLGQMVARLRPENGRVIGVLTGTGDRRDSDIRELGEIVAGFMDEIILKETTLLRGRRPGEVPRLLREGLLAGGMKPDAITFIEDECDATDAALRRARPGDLLLIFCDSYATCWGQVVNFQPAPPADAKRAAVDFSELDADDALFFPEMATEKAAIGDPK
jgi:cyanophycin synthetase